MTKQIIVTISRYGDTKVEAEGFSGTGCLEATQAIEAALAGDAGKRNLKPEYDEAEAASETEMENVRF